MVAISGLGKSTLAERHPGVVLDADRWIYEAVAIAFQDLEPRARLRAWRDLVDSRPWEHGGDALQLWSRTRRTMFGGLHEALRRGEHRIVLTSLLEPAWPVWRYYGIERGSYLEHLKRANRTADNHQSEAANMRLEGYEPLIRLPAGTFLSQCQDLQNQIAG